MLRGRRKTFHESALRAYDLGLLVPPPAFPDRIRGRNHSRRAATSREAVASSRSIYFLQSSSWPLKKAGDINVFLPCGIAALASSSQVGENGFPYLMRLPKST